MTMQKNVLKFHILLQHFIHVLLKKRTYLKNYFGFFFFSILLIEKCKTGANVRDCYIVEQNSKVYSTFDNHPHFLLF